jgi:hypothetical protein
MFLSIILITLITLGSFGLTYLFADDEPFFWRICAGNVIGSTIFSLICFVFACFFGFTTLTISVAYLISLLPTLLFVNKKNRAKLQANWRAAKSKLEDADFNKILQFAYYAFFFILFYFFFERAVFQTPDGIFTGASQNFGDLPFHLGAIFSFTDGQNFPPENPSYAFAKFSYPFMADLITASFIKLGASLRDAMLAQNFTLAVSLLVVLERFAFKLTGNRLAGKIAPFLLFFSGGLGFLWFAKDYWQSAQGFFDFIWKLPNDYTISEKFRWGNSLVVLFITQRSLLLGMPLTIIVLQKLWDVFRSGKVENRKSEKVEDLQNDDSIADPKFSILHFPLSIFVVGLLAGTLPLVHVHSLAVLFVVGAFAFFFRSDKWREWIAFAVGVAIVAVPELIWAMSGSATRLTEFVAWNFGWDKRENGFLWFWIKNTGAFIPILICALALVFTRLKDKKAEAQTAIDSKNFDKISNAPFTVYHLYFYLPFLLCFVVSNVMKLAPWEWDNIKVLIYWFVGSIPFVAYVLARLWETGKILKAVAAIALFALTFSGALDVWRTMSKQTNFEVFSKDAVAVSEQIKQRIAPNALFVNAPTFNSAIVLTGRRSLMRYGGHLSSYGIDYGEREDEVKRIYAGDAAAGVLFKKYNVEYVLVGPEEAANVPIVNEEFFRQFPVVAEAGQYRVYQVKK